MCVGHHIAETMFTVYENAKKPVCGFVGFYDGPTQYRVYSAKDDSAIDMKNSGLSYN